MLSWFWHLCLNSILENTTSPTKQSTGSLTSSSAPRPVNEELYIIIPALIWATFLLGGLMYHCFCAKPKHSKYIGNILWICDWKYIGNMMKCVVSKLDLLFLWKTSLFVENAFVSGIMLLCIVLRWLNANFYIDDQLLFRTLNFIAVEWVSFGGISNKSENICYNSMDSQVPTNLCDWTQSSVWALPRKSCLRIPEYCTKGYLSEPTPTNMSRIHAQDFWGWAQKPHIESFLFGIWLNICHKHDTPFRARFC